MVRREIPVSRETNDTPPLPIALLSAAAQRRRCRSFNAVPSNRKRVRMASPVSTQTFYAKNVSIVPIIY
jgi:hypothetical protein